MPTFYFSFTALKFLGLSKHPRAPGAEGYCSKERGLGCPACGKRHSKQMGVLWPRTALLRLEVSFVLVLLGGKWRRKKRSPGSGVTTVSQRLELVHWLCSWLNELTGSMFPGRHPWGHRRLLSTARLDGGGPLNLHSFTAAETLVLKPSGRYLRLTVLFALQELEHVLPSWGEVPCSAASVNCIPAPSSCTPCAAPPPCPSTQEMLPHLSQNLRGRGAAQFCCDTRKVAPGTCKQGFLNSCLLRRLVMVGRGVGEGRDWMGNGIRR